MLFLKRINEGKLYLDDLELLDEIALNKEYKDTPEGAFYFKMLLSDDGLKSKTASQKITSQNIFENPLQKIDPTIKTPEEQEKLD